jgi:hypothetical protein
MEGKEVQGFSLTTVLAIGVAAAAVGMGYAEWRVRSVEQELQVSPRVAVLPVYDTIEAKVKGGMAADEAANVPMEVARRLADQGFIVLDADRVYAYPAPLEVKP